MFLKRRLVLGGLAGLATWPDAAWADTAPEIARAGLQWLNVAAPLPLAALRGRVVILDFWTEGCINCIHIVPTLRRVEQRFPDRVVVVGVHSPKFQNEQDPASVASAIQRYGIRHPVVNDPKMAIWRDYQVRGWPTLVLLDAAGAIAGRVESEPDPDAFERMVQALVDQAASGGTLRPATLAVQVKALPVRRFLFPGKLKRITGEPRQWALADAGHHQVVVLDDRGGDIRRIGAGTPGFRDGPAERALFNQPQGLISDHRGIYVADTGNHAIRRIDRATRAVTTLAGTGGRGRSLHAPASGRNAALASPWDLEIVGDSLFFANAGTHQIGALDLSDGQVRPYAGTGAEDLTSGDGEDATFAQPSGLAVDPGGARLFVADSESSAVRAITLGRNPQVATLVGAGLFEFGWVNGPAGQARLQHPLGVAAFGNAVLVADTYNSTIRVIDLAQHSVRDFDDGSFTCNDPLCLPAREPAGVVADGPDRVLLVDTGNHRIDVYQPSTRAYRTWAA